MYPPGAAVSAADCQHCHLRRDVCICASRPQLASRAGFHLLVHPRELHKPTNTGHLVVDTVAGAQWHIWSRLQPPAELLAALASPRISYLVFPAQWAGAMSVAGAVDRHCVAPQFVLLDATWQQARKMLRQSAYLRQLPLLALPAGLHSCYSLRRRRCAGHLATAEAAVALLRMIGEAQQAARLDSYYRLFLRHFGASRNGRGPGA